jgi:hypothetical protein
VNVRKMLGSAFRVFSHTSENDQDRLHLVLIQHPSQKLARICYIVIGYITFKSTHVRKLLGFTTRLDVRNRLGFTSASRDTSLTTTRCRPKIKTLSIINCELAKNHIKILHPLRNQKLALDIEQTTKPKPQGQLPQPQPKHTHSKTK